MRNLFCASAALLGLSALASAAALLALDEVAKRTVPFDRLVVFGDEFSDNGDGSWAHGLDDMNIYGYHTWTDGPVMVEYLAKQLGIPLLDYAWGGKNGGGLYGSTVSNTFTRSEITWRGGEPVPSTLQQIGNYSSGRERAGASRSLHLIWANCNDLKQHTTWYARPSSKITVNNPANAQFIEEYAKLLTEQAESLVRLAGENSPGVVVVNQYPIEKAPQNWMYFCKKTPGCGERWGAVVHASNEKLKASLAASPYAHKFFYYDVYGYMNYLMANKNHYGFTAGLNDLCDGEPGLPTTHLKECIRDGHFKWGAARPYFWFNNGQMSTIVHELIAGNLKQKLAAHFRF